VECEVLPVVLVWLLVVLLWREPEAGDSMASTSRSIKIFWGSLDLDAAVVMLRLSRHRGGGEEESIDPLSFFVNL
jgi:hypothetical protein